MYLICFFSFICFYSFFCFFSFIFIFIFISSLLLSIMSLCLTPLPFKLRIISMHKKDVGFFTYGLMNVLTSLSKIKFFSMIESQDSVSCVISSVGFGLLYVMDKRIMVGPDIWKAIIVSEGEIVNASLVSLVSEVLAKSGYPILYISASAMDYVLVMDSQFDDAMRCLAESVTIIQHQASNDADIVEAEEIAAVKKTDASTNLEQTVDVSKSQLKLHLIPERLVLSAMKFQDFDACFRKLLRQILFPLKERFFSFLCHDEELSLMLDVDSFNQLELHKGSMEPATWCAIEVVGEFAFNETGLVWSVSAPLSKAGISPFYMSSFHTGFIIVAEERLEEVKFHLTQKFNFVD